MARFKVIEGSHQEDGQVYDRGQVVESDLPLVALFPEKFREEPELAARSAPPAPLSPPKGKPSEPPPTTKPAKGKKTAPVGKSPASDAEDWES